MTGLHSRFELAQLLAKQTGEILLQIASGKQITPSFKTDHSIVTEADTAADKFIHSSIQQHFPGDRVLSEELNPSQPAFLDSEDHFLWIVDPLDGTTNFSLGLPFWGVSIACLQKGEPVAAAINFPVLGELYTAHKGSGANLNNHPLEPDDFYSQAKLSFFSACSRTYQQYKVSVPYKTRILGSTCYNLCSVAKGTSILGFDATPKIWDIAAGWLIILEANKAIDTLNAQVPFPLSGSIDYSKISFPTIAGANKAVLAKARNQIIPYNA